MKPRLFLTLALVALFWLTLGVLVRSFSVADVWRTQGQIVFGAAVSHGELVFWTSPDDGHFTYRHHLAKPAAGTFDWLPHPVLGFDAGVMNLTRFAAIPLWAVAVGFLVYPIRVRRHLRLSSPKPVGTCAACGYDLRATPDRCPECGTETTGGTDIPVCH